MLAPGKAASRLPVATPRRMTSSTPTSRKSTKATRRSALKRDAHFLKRIRHPVSPPGAVFVKWLETTMTDPLTNHRDAGAAPDGGGRFERQNPIGGTRERLT